MRYDVFISYAREDYDHALALQHQIQERGLTTFLAPLRIAGGARWRKEIRIGVAHSREFVLLASKASLASQWVLAECGAAWGFDKRITPVLVDVSPRSIPAWLEEYQCVELTNTEGLIARLVDPRGRLIRASSGSVRELQLLEAMSGEVKPVAQARCYEILRAQLHLADAATVLGVDFQIQASGGPRSYKLFGRGPSSMPFADLEYQVYEGDCLVWGGVMCLYVAAPLNGAWRGFWLARSDSSPGNVCLGTIEVPAERLDAAGGATAAAVRQVPKQDD
jgi:hypothetical protein